MKVELLKNLAIIYASAISTISLVWNIYNEIQKRKRKLKVEITTNLVLIPEKDISGSLAKTNNSNHLVKIPVIRLTITNVGNVPIYIERPLFKLRFGKPKYFQVIPIPDPFGLKLTLFEGIDLKYPLKIEPGERKNIDFNALSLLEELEKYHKNKWKRFNGFKAIIKDTYGKKFSSNLIPLKHIENIVRIVKEENNFEFTHQF